MAAVSAIPAIPAAILARARSSGDRPAIVYRDQVFSYAELARASESFAAAVGARPASAPVAIVAHRTPATVAAIVGTMLAGRAYVPVNPADPPARQATIFAAAGVSHLADPLAGPDLLHPAIEQLPGRLAPDAPDVPGPPGPHQAGPRLPAEHAPSPERLAYIFFTSGSTGAPKGVPLSHRNASAFADWAGTAFGIHPGDRIGVYAPLFFDLSTFDLFVGLTAGAALVMVPDDVAKLSRSALDCLRDGKVSVLYAVPSALLWLLAAAQDGAALPDLRLLLLAGEQFPSAQLETLRRAAPLAALHNLFGPIESNVVSHFAVPDGWDPGTPVPIGTAVSGATLGVLDETGAVLTEPGSAGELVISGPSVFGGYLRADPAPPDPFLTVEGRRWYRTGDLASVGSDGNFRFHGRRDTRLKIRGFLVELAEVEQALNRSPDVASAVVVAVDDAAGRAEIHAFVVPADQQAPVTAREALRWCGQLLPRYMWPAQVHVIPELPLARTGKVDRRGLLQTVAGKTP